MQITPEEQIFCQFSLWQGDAEDQIWEHPDVEGSDIEDVEEEGEVEEDTEESSDSLNKKLFAQWLKHRKLKGVVLAFRAAAALYEDDKDRLAQTPARYD